jgi:antitoxin FitA
MAALSIRNLDEQVKERLRVRAALNRRSMEAEIREILTEAVAEPKDRGNFLIALHERFQELGGVELDIPPRATGMRPPPTFE